MHISLFGTRGMRVRELESRLMLSAAPAESDSALSFLASDVTTFWGDLVSPVSDAAGSSGGSTPSSLPAIPFDDSLSPLSDVPDLDDPIRLPGDANDDGSIDFLDFLLLQQNYGSENATWAQGDFTGDGRVGFDDLLLLASRF